MSHDTTTAATGGLVEIQITSGTVLCPVHHELAPGSSAPPLTPAPPSVLQQQQQQQHLPNPTSPVAMRDARRLTAEMAFLDPQQSAENANNGYSNSNSNSLPLPEFSSSSKERARSHDRHHSTSPRGVVIAHGDNGASLTFASQQTTTGSTVATGRPDVADSAHSADDLESAPDSPLHLLNVSSTAFIGRDDDGVLQQVNDLELYEQLGRGAYGCVYVACSPRFDEVVAVKEIPRRAVERSPAGPRVAHIFDGASLTKHELDAAAAASATTVTGTRTATSLVHEADVMSRLRHENVVRVLEVIDDPAEDSVFIVMEFVAGRQAGAVSVAATKGDSDTVDAPRFACTTLPEDELRIVARDVAAALHYCQQQKVVHGDVKPENVLLEHTSSSPQRTGVVARAKLADFGVAVALQGGRVQRDDVDAPEPLAASVAYDAGDVSFAPWGASATSAQAFSAAGSPSAGVSRRASIVATAAAQSHPTRSGGGVVRAKPPSDEAPMATGRSAFGGRRCASPSSQQRNRENRARDCPRGTPAFLAPELVSGAARSPTPASDAWALGITLFALRYGYLPFDGTTPVALNAAIVAGEPRPFPPMGAAPGSEAWHTERRWRSVLRGLLQPDPAERLTAQALLRTALLRPSATSA